MTDVVAMLLWMVLVVATVGVGRRPDVGQLQEVQVAVFDQIVVHVRAAVAASRLYVFSKHPGRAHQTQQSEHRHGQVVFEIIDDRG